MADAANASNDEQSKSQQQPHPHPDQEQQQQQQPPRAVATTTTIAMTATSATAAAPASESDEQQQQQQLNLHHHQTSTLSSDSEFGGSTDSLNSNTDTVVPGSDNESDNRDAVEPPTVGVVRFASVRAKSSPTVDKMAQQSAQSVHSMLFNNEYVYIRPNGQTKLVPVGGGRKSAASIMMAGVTASPADAARAAQQPQQPPPQQPPQPSQAQRLIITTSQVTVQSPATLTNSNGSLVGPATTANVVQPSAAHASTTAGSSSSGSNGGGGQPPQARVIMFCQPSSIPFQTRNIVLEPNQEVKVGRSITRNRVSDNNAIFDCKVLSRNHAQIWMSDGKFYIRDTASSNGTFVNDQRLSLTTTSSKPFEVKSGDIVQFGVDVLENAYKDRHGCIVTLLKFSTGSDADDLTDPSACMRALAAANGANSGTAGGLKGGGGSGMESLSSYELYRLNEFIQEAMLREQLLESKLMALQTVVELTRKNSASVWHSMIEEDHLLGRIDILENKLQYFQTNATDDKLRTEMCKLQDDKSVYQISAKEALRKVYEERNEAVMKLTAIERALCSSEDECALLRNQLARTQQSFKEATVSLAQLEERSVDAHEHDRQLAEAYWQRDQQVVELCEQLKEKAEEAHQLERQLRGMQEQCEDLHARIETYAKMGERRGGKRRQGGGGGDEDDDDNEERDFDEDYEDEDDDDEEADDDDEDGGGLAERQSGSSTVNSWLDRLSAEAEKEKACKKKSKRETDQKKNKSHNNKKSADGMEDIDANLRTLDKLLSTLKHNRETSESIVPPVSNKVQNDDNQNSDATAANTDQIKSAESPSPVSLAPPLQPSALTANGNADAELLCTIAAQLRQVYADMLLNVVQQGAAAAKELDTVQAQLKACQLQNAELAGKEQRAAERLIDWQSRCQTETQLAADLNVRCADLEQRLAEADAMQSLAAAVDDDDDDDDDDAAAAAAAVNEEEDTRSLTTIAVQTDSSNVEPQPVAERPNGSCDTATIVTSTSLAHTAAPAASAVSFELSDYSDDIALLTDPAVRREEELIAFKEECERLREQLTAAQKQLSSSAAAGAASSGVAMATLSLAYVAVAVAVIGYIIFSPYW